MQTAANWPPLLFPEHAGFAGFKQILLPEQAGDDIMGKRGKNAFNNKSAGGGL
jgi:hypothetical protein